MSGVFLNDDDGISSDDDLIKKPCANCGKNTDSIKDNDMVFCDFCDECYHQKCHPGLESIPKNKWYCAKCRNTQKFRDFLKEQEVVKIPCSECGDWKLYYNNDMVFCERCEQCWHQQCHRGLRKVPQGDWYCWKCSKFLEDSQVLWKRYEDRDRDTELKPMMQKLLVPQLVKTVYSAIQKRSGELGGNAGGGAIYGEMTIESCERVIYHMKEWMHMDSNSFFIDVGSGLGKPTFHAAMAGVKYSFGVEIIKERWLLSLHNLLPMLQDHDTIQEIDHARDRDKLPHSPKKFQHQWSKTSDTIVSSPTISQSCNFPKNVFFMHADMTLLSSFNPFTHIFMFDIGFSPASLEILAHKFNTSSSAQYLVSFQRPHDIIYMFGFHVVFLGMHTCKMTGSGENHSGYYYKKTYVKPHPADVASSFARVDSEEARIDYTLLPSPAFNNQVVQWVEKEIAAPGNTNDTIRIVDVSEIFLNGFKLLAPKNRQFYIESLANELELDIVKGKGNGKMKIMAKSGNKEHETRHTLLKKKETGAASSSRSNGANGNHYKDIVVQKKPMNKALMKIQNYNNPGYVEQIVDDDGQPVTLKAQNKDLKRGYNCRSYVEKNRCNHAYLPCFMYGDDGSRDPRDKEGLAYDKKVESEAKKKSAAKEASAKRKVASSKNVTQKKLKKRAKVEKKQSKTKPMKDDVNEDDYTDDDVSDDDDEGCRVCGIVDERGKNNQILFCDICDHQYHQQCHRPILKSIPKGDWYCAVCDDNADTANRLDMLKVRLQMLHEKLQHYSKN